MLDQHVVLVGFMGCGKSTVGPLLAKRIGAKFVDVDQYIVRQAGRTIPEIFATEGESGFRQRETEALREILALPPHVIAAGGGLIERAENRQMLRESARCVWLRVPIETLLARVGDDANRPLLQNDPGFVRARKLYASREPLYAEADLHIDASRSPEQSVETIMAALRVRPAGAQRKGGDVNDYRNSS